MLPLLKSNQPVTSVVEERVLSMDDVVFCPVKGRYGTHKIPAIRGTQYQIGNMRGFMNGWVTRDGIFGKVTHIWDK